MNPKRILVIEDEQVVAQDLKNLLVRCGYQPLGPASTGSEAMQMAAETMPDLILMDVCLAGEMSGVEAARAIARERDVPIIYVTAYAEWFLRGTSEMVSPFLCVVKPFSASALQAAIESSLPVAESRPN